MSALPPILPVSPLAGPAAATAPFTPLPQAGGHGSFASFLQQTVGAMEAKVTRADQLVKAFALDDNVPVHQVTFALEEARLAVELTMQVRARLLEGYRDLMNMQL